MASVTDDAQEPILKIFGEMTKRKNRQGRDPSIEPNTLYILCNPMAPVATQEFKTATKAAGDFIDKSGKNYSVVIIEKEDYNDEVKDGAFRQNFWQLWARASNTLQDDEAFDGEHLCDPVMSGDFFETDKLKETINFIFLVTNDNGQVLTFMTVRDLSSIEEILSTRETETRTGDMAEWAKKEEKNKRKRNDIEYSPTELDGTKLKQKYLEKSKGENYLYIDGICSKERGVAMNLLKFLQKICCNSDYYKGIKLAAITYVIKLYYKYGFKFDAGNDDDSDKINEQVPELDNIREDDAIFKDEQWLKFIEKIQGIKGITTTQNPIIEKQFDRMRRYFEYEGKTPIYEGKRDNYEERMKNAFDSHEVLVNGFNMKWDKGPSCKLAKPKSCEQEKCAILGGGKNSKKRTKKKARRRKRKRTKRKRRRKKKRTKKRKRRRTKKRR